MIQLKLQTNPINVTIKEKDGWSYVPMAEVCKFIGGSQPPKQDFVYEPLPDYIRLIQIQDYKSDKKKTFIPKSKARKFCTKEDIMIGRYGPPIFQILRGLEGAYNVALMKAAPKNENVLDREYLYYFLHNPTLFNYVVANSERTAGQDGVRKELLENYIIPLPPLEEQRRIAAILDKADGVRRKRQEAIRLTEELLRSQFLEMFGDPVTNPKGWEMVTVGDIVSDVRDGPHVSPKYSDEGIPILSTRNIRPAQLIMEDMKYVSKETYLDLVKTFRPQRGDVLLTKGGTTGYAKTVDWDWSFAIWVHIAALRPTEKIRPEFLEAALNSPNCYQQSQRYTHGIANKDLGLTRIRKIKLSLPPLALQDKYCCLRERLLKQLVPQKKSLNESDNLFNSLLQRAFRGEL